MLNFNELIILLKIIIVIFILPIPIFFGLKQKNLKTKYMTAFLITTISITILNAILIKIGMSGEILLRTLFWGSLGYGIYGAICNYKEIRRIVSELKKTISDLIIITIIFLIAIYLRIKPSITNHLFHAFDIYNNYLQTILIEHGKLDLFYFNLRYYVLTYHTFNSSIHKIVGENLFYIYRFVGPIIAIITIIFLYFILSELRIDKKVTWLIIAAFSWIGKKSYLGFQILERGNQTLAQEFAFIFYLILLYFIVRLIKKETFMNKLAIFLSFFFVQLVHPTVIGLLSFFTLNLFFIINIFIQRVKKTPWIFFLIINSTYIFMLYIVKFKFFTNNLIYIFAQFKIFILIGTLLSVIIALYLNKYKDNLFRNLKSSNRITLFYIIFFEISYILMGMLAFIINNYASTTDSYAISIRFAQFFYMNLLLSFIAIIKIEKFNTKLGSILFLFNFLITIFFVNEYVHPLWLETEMSLIFSIIAIIYLTYILYNKFNNKIARIIAVVGLIVLFLILTPLPIYPQFYGNSAFIEEFFDIKNEKQDILNSTFYSIDWYDLNINNHIELFCLDFGCKYEPLINNETSIDSNSYIFLEKKLFLSENSLYYNKKIGYSIRDNKTGRIEYIISAVKNKTILSNDIFEQFIQLNLPIYYEDEGTIIYHKN